MTQATAQPKRRRTGGRKARQNLRASPLAEDKRPVRSGLSGGHFRPLDDAGMARIYQGALQLLEEVGLADAPPSGVKIMTEAGALLGDDGRLRFPRSLVEDMLAIAGRNFTLHGQKPVHDLEPGASRVHYGTAGAAVHLVDLEKREYRDSSLIDIYEAARIIETLDNIHFFQRPMVARDMESSLELDLNTVYAAMAGTTKHIGASFISVQNFEQVLEMLHVACGSEEAWRERPFVSNSNCFVVPPMRFATEACEVMEACIRGGMPVLLLSAGQAGATAPAAIAGTLTQAVAECLAGVVYVNAIKPGHPAIFGTWPFVSDLRTGAMSGGSGEQALITAACGQMAQYLDLPGGSAAGMADAKLPDIQAGYEKGISNVMAGLSGLNMVYEAAGMHGSLMGFCLESLIIDNDMIGQCLRCVRGIEVNDETISIESIRDVCLEGPGHYLGHNQTLELMETEYLYPKFGDRTTPKIWAELGKRDILERAIEEKRQILENSYPYHLSPETDARIRARFPVRLPLSAMNRE
jgi:trimethylamine---corrinoid protein Co-methyltransferase